MLKNAPYFGGQQRDLPDDFKLEDNGLIPVACETWHDWIFVNLLDTPTPIEDFLQPILEQLGDKQVTEYRPVATLDMGLVDCNWKLLMENFIEPYHVQFVHNKTTDQPLENHRTVINRHCVGSAVELSDNQAANARAGTLGVSSHYLTLFPNFVLATYQPDQLGVHLNVPVSAGSTRQKRVIYLHKEANHPECYANELLELWRKVHLEDHEMCVRLQQGRHSPKADDGGLLSPAWENSVRRFQELVADEIRPLLT